MDYCWHFVLNDLLNDPGLFVHDFSMLVIQKKIFAFRIYYFILFLYYHNLSNKLSDTLPNI